MYCPNCGKNCPDKADALFCMSCGARLPHADEGETVAIFRGASHDEPDEAEPYAPKESASPYGGSSYSTDTASPYGGSSYLPESASPYGGSSYSTDTASPYGGSPYSPESASPYGGSPYASDTAYAPYAAEQLPGAYPGAPAAKRKKKKGKAIAAAVVSVGAVLAVALTAFVLIFDISFADVFGAKSWFRPENGNQTAPLQMLSAMEKSVFDTKSCKYKIEIMGFDMDGTVVWGTSLLDSTILLHADLGRMLPDGVELEEAGSTDMYLYLHDAKLYITDGKKNVAGVDFSNSSKGLPNYNDFAKQVKATIDDDALSSFLLENVFTGDRFKKMMWTVKFNHLNQQSVEAMFDAELTLGMMALSLVTTVGIEKSQNGKVSEDLMYDALDTFADAYQKRSDEFPDFRSLVGLLTDFLSTDQAMVSFDVTAEGTARNGSFKLKIDVPELVCDYLEYLLKHEKLRKWLDLLLELTGVDRLPDFEEQIEDFYDHLDDEDEIDEMLDSLYTQMYNALSSPVVISYKTEKGRMTSFKLSYEGETLFRFDLSEVNAVKFKASDYEFIEELPGKRGVNDDEFYESFDDYLDELEDALGDLFSNFGSIGGGLFGGYSDEDETYAALNPLSLAAR